MSWREALTPLRMERVALVAPEEHCRDMLVEVARSASVELDLSYATSSGPGSGAGSATGTGTDEIERAQADAVTSGPLVGLVGWVPGRALAPLADALAPWGAAAVPIDRPRGLQPPTLLTGTRSPRVSRSLVDAYGTVPYADVDPSRLAGLAYVVMFGMMFGDVGQGAILVLVGLLLRSGRVRRLERLAQTGTFVAAAGLCATFFGALYGSFFGPTGVIPVLWLDPLEDPIPLLVTGVALGAVLLAGAYTLGTINRVREGGWGYALYARSGVAGSLLFGSVGLLTWGLVADLTVLVVLAVVLSVAALVLVFVGLLIEAGGGGTGVMQALVELVDTVIRLGSNLISFARLAAFGLTHAALLAIVWDGTTGLWGPGWRAVAAVLVFLLGNALTFALEALVAAIQALRLEYYELFSRVFESEGRPFRPWVPDVGSTVPAGSTVPVSSPAPTREGRPS